MLGRRSPVCMCAVSTGSNNQNTVAPVPGMADMQDTQEKYRGQTKANDTS